MADLSGPWEHGDKLLLRVEEERDRLRAERDKLLAFKNWCHAYLDTHGVPHHPPGTHGAAGCRIGDRMDWLMDRLKAAEAEVAALRRQVEGHCARIAAQSELLSKRAEKGGADAS